MDFSFIRGEISSENSHNHVISVLLSQDRFCFYIAEKESINLPVQFISRQLPETGIEKLISEFENCKEYDNLIFHKSVIIFHTNRYSLVPDEFYSAEYQDRFMNLLHSEEDHTSTIVSVFPDRNINIVFQMPEKLRNVIKSKFPHCSIIHSAYPSLHFGFQKSEPSCIVNHFGSSISVTIFNERELKLFNIFPIRDENDLIYYVGLAMRCCNMKNQETNLYLMGEEDKDSKDYQMISRYFNKPVSYNPQPDATNNPDFPSGMLFNHLEAIHCVS